MEYREVAEARGLSGLRLVLTRGFPNPWGEFAKGVFRVKRLPFVAVSQYPGKPDAELRDWIGQNSAPAAVYGDEPARTSWAPILHLAERLEPDPPLLPLEEHDRILMLGLCEEIAGEDGLGWNRRRKVIIDSLNTQFVAPEQNGGVNWVAIKYGGPNREGERERVVARMVTVLRAVGTQAEAMRAAGERYLIGGRLSALDLLWAGFSQLLDPLSRSVCSISEEVRTLYTETEPRIRAALTPELMAHRDFIYTEHMTPPANL